MMSKAKAKLMEKMMDSMMGDFNPEQLIDMMLEKPLLVYAEIAFFKTDTGKLCCTINKLSKPKDYDDLHDHGRKVIVLPTVEPTAENKTEANPNAV